MSKIALVRATIVVSAISLSRSSVVLVPIEMRERYEAGQGRTRRRHRDVRPVPAVPGEGRRNSWRRSRNEPPVPACVDRRSCRVAVGLTSGAPEPTLATVLERAAAYVADFHRQLSGVVAEERYVQEVKAFAKRPGRLSNPMRSELHSDLLLVRPADGGEWTEFRDVFEVNGIAVRDRRDRLTRLFLEGSRVGARADRPDPGRELALQHRRHRAQHQHADLRAADSRERRTRRASSSSAPDDRVPATLAQGGAGPVRFGRERRSGRSSSRRSGPAR